MDEDNKKNIFENMDNNEIIKSLEEKYKNDKQPIYRQDDSYNLYFISKYLPDSVKKKAKSEEELRLLELVHFTEFVLRKSFKRMDKLFEKLAEKNNDCLIKNCKSTFDWIEQNSFYVGEESYNTSGTTRNHNNPYKENFRPYREIKFKDIETGKIGAKKLREYKACKMNCDLNVQALKNKFYNRTTNWEIGLNTELEKCKVRSVDNELMKVDCFSKTMFFFLLAIPEYEFELNYHYKKLVEDYENMQNRNKPSLYNLNQERKFTDVILNRYL